MKKIVNKWSPEELQFLLENYFDLGPRGCSSVLGRKPSIIAVRASHLGLKTKIVKGRPKRKVYEKNIDYWVCECPTHGKQNHYHKNRSGPRCVVCEKEYTVSEVGQEKRRKTRRKRRSTLIGKYEQRIRATLKHYSDGKISFSKHLDYSAQELVLYIANIHKQRSGRCNMCCGNFNLDDMDIDHIVPVSTGETIQEIRELFRLENLQPLCPRCNRHIKRAKVGVH